jgi:hypothetical protein
MSRKDLIISASLNTGYRVSGIRDRKRDRDKMVIARAKPVAICNFSSFPFGL